MAAARYRAAPAALLRVRPLDGGLHAVFHRPSGATHLVAEPVPELLAALAGRDATAAELMERLARDYDLAESDPAALGARLDELVAAGLVEKLAAA